MIVDGRGFGEQCVARYQRGDGRKDCEQSVEHHTGGERQQPVVIDLLIGAVEDALPERPAALKRFRRIAGFAFALAALERDGGGIGACQRQPGEQSRLVAMPDRIENALSQAHMGTTAIPLQSFDKTRGKLLCSGRFRGFPPRRFWSNTPLARGIAPAYPPRRCASRPAPRYYSV